MELNNIVVGGFYETRGGGMYRVIELPLKHDIRKVLIRDILTATTHRPFLKSFVTCCVRRIDSGVK